jgi:hypothetical protein
LPEFAMEITNSSKMLPVLACENLQQIKAFKQARAISSKLGNKDSLPEQLIHLPFPSITGECRMYRSSPENKIFVSDKQPKIKAIAEKLPESVLNYYSAVIPKEISGKKIRTRKDFAESFSYLQKKIGCG